MEKEIAKLLLQGYVQSQNWLKASPFEKKCIVNTRKLSWMFLFVIYKQSLLIETGITMFAFVIV